MPPPKPSGRGARPRSSAASSSRTSARNRSRSAAAQSPRCAAFLGQRSGVRSGSGGVHVNRRIASAAPPARQADPPDDHHPPDGRDQQHDRDHEAPVHPDVARRVPSSPAAGGGELDHTIARTDQPGPPASETTTAAFRRTWPWPAPRPPGAAPRRGRSRWERRVATESENSDPRSPRSRSPPTGARRKCVRLRGRTAPGWAHSRTAWQGRVPSSRIRRSR